MSIRTIPGALGAVALGVALIPAPAWAAAQSGTSVAHGITVFVPASEGATVPCIGPGGSPAPADVTLTITGVIRTTTNKNGFHEFVFYTGTFEADLVGGGTASGRVTSPNVGNAQASGAKAMATEVWTGRILSGVGAGTKWTSVVHFTGTADQTLAKTLFDKTVCH